MSRRRKGSPMKDASKPFQKIIVAYDDSPAVHARPADTKRRGE
jgi:hypothetical protein